MLSTPVPRSAGDLKNAMLACWLWVGYGWNMLEKGLCLGKGVLTSDVLSLVCPAEDMHCLVPEIQRCQLRSFPILPKLVGYCNFMTFSKDLKGVK